MVDFELPDPETVKVLRSQVVNDVGGGWLRQRSSATAENLMHRLSWSDSTSMVLLLSQFIAPPVEKVTT
jgi:hypothetical protein